MSNWIKEHSDVLYKVGYLIIMLIVFFVSMDFRVKGVEEGQSKHIRDYEDYRYYVEQTYLRKDVTEQILQRLERIERKIDARNEN